MQVFADIFLGAGALGAAFYCLILARRLNRFNNLEKGVGGAVAVLSSQVEQLAQAMGEAQTASEGSADTLARLTEKAESMAQRLELLIASLHDLPAAPEPQAEPERAAAQPTTDGDQAPMFTRHPRRLNEAA